MKILKSISAIASILSMIIYQYFLLVKDIELDEMWFIVMSCSVAVFGFTGLTKKDSIFVSSLVVLMSAFYIAVTLIYLYRWCMLGDGSTNYYTAIYASTVLTFIYLIWYVRKHKQL